MPKVGPKEQGAYDPFSSIADSLSDLAAQPDANSVATAPAPTPPANPVRRQAAPLPEQPVVVEPEQAAPAPEPPPQTPTRVSGAGRDDPAAAPAQTRKVSSTTAMQTTKRFKTTRREASELDAAAVKLGAALGVSVDFSKVTRALWDVYLRHQEDILRNVPSDEVWHRPANSDAAGLAELDERLSELINDGLMVACRRPQNSRGS